MISNEMVDTKTGRRYNQDGLGCTTNSIYPNGGYWDYTPTKWGSSPVFLTELQRRSDEWPCAERLDEGPTTCTRQRGHSGQHCAPIRWKSWG